MSDFKSRLGYWTGKSRPGLGEKLSKMFKGRKRDPIAVEKTASALRGRPRRPHSLETRIKISKSLTGKKQSQETVVKRIISNTGKKRDPSFGQKLRVLFTGCKRSNETKEKMRLAKLGTTRSQETKDKISRRLIELNKDVSVIENKRTKMLNGGVEKRILTNTARYGRADGPVQDTWIEIEAKRVLDILGVPYLFQKGFCGNAVDFLLPDRKLVIEVDGCYYHCCQRCYPGSDYPVIEKDKRVAERIRSKGYNLVRVWEHDMDRFEEIIKPVLIKVD